MADEMTFKHVLPVQIRFNDVDQYGHMNNSSYFSLYDLAKTSYLRDVFGQKEWNRIGIVVANINADFLAPVFYWLLRLLLFIWDTRALPCFSVQWIRSAVFANASAVR